MGTWRAGTRVTWKKAEAARWNKVSGTKTWGEVMVHLRGWELARLPSLCPAPPRAPEQAHLCSNRNTTLWWKSGWWLSGSWTGAAVSPLALCMLQHMAILRSALCMFLCIYSALLYPRVTLLLVWLPGALQRVPAIKQGPRYGGYACWGAAPPA